MKKLICAILLVLLMATCLVGCSQIADNTQYYDAITKKCKLEKSYEGKNFLTDGIGVVTLSALTDGDTTRFKSGNDTVIIRYYCIDTPESTGSVEKWGKAASLFVKEKLSNAELIVLESSTGGRPEKDSYGTRYLGYVWYKTANDDNLKNLNLELIENGFTENKALETADYAYYDYMSKANKFAKSIKLRIYSDLEDPLYSTDPAQVTVKDLLEDINSEDSQYYNAESDAGSKVIFDAYLESLSTSDSGTNTFKAVQYDAETGKKYEINLYAGYSSYSSSRMKLGTLYRIIGTIQKYNGSFQISGVEYNEIYQEQLPNGSFILQKNYYLTFNSNTEYVTQFSYNLFTSVTVVSVNVADGTLTIEGTAEQRTKTGIKANSEQTYTFKVKVADGYVTDLKQGDKFTATGYKLDENSNVITVVGSINKIN